MHQVGWIIVGMSSKRQFVLVSFLLFLAGFGYFGFLKQEPTEPEFAAKVVNQAMGVKAPPSLDLLTADFDEPFIPTVKGADKAPLAGVLEKYKADKRSKDRKVDLLEAFLEEHPNDPWAPSVRVNLGLHYHRVGRFTRALSQLRQGWEALKDYKEPRLKALADHALGEYAITLAHLGRIEDLEPLLESVRGRSLRGSATELIASAREGLATMHSNPEHAFWCGPSALRRIGEREEFWGEHSQKILETLPSTKKGTSLTQCRDLSERLGMNFQMAYREPGAEVITPAVAHWKAGHFAALLEPTDGLYPVEDDTAGFGRTEVRVNEEGLNEESSGYFLVPPGPLPSGWRAVPQAEGDTVWGRGYTGLRKNSNATGNNDSAAGGCPPGTCCVGAGGPGGGPGASGSGGGGGGGFGTDFTSPGMTTWDAHTMLVSLRLRDTPVGLSPAAFTVPFTVTYAQREANQPAVFDYSNLGPKWTTNWTSFITDQRATSQNVLLYKSGGGSEAYEFASGSSTSEKGAYSQAFLTDTGSGFELVSQNGAKVTYGQLIGGRYHVSSASDPQGNTINLEYDTLGRLAVVRDPVGRAMTLSYELTDDPLKITRVTDPFGRSADFTYTPDGHLESITDVQGLVSSYQYGDNDFIHTLTTPYGSTTFEYGDINTDPDLGVVRYLEFTDTEGRKSRLESSNHGPFSATEVPAGIPIFNITLNYRNSYYWEPQQLDATPDHSKATVYHFLHEWRGAIWITGRELESIKRPLENRIWYIYAKHVPRYFDGDNNIAAIGRVLGDGTTQLTQYQYNSIGNRTQTTDPLGRVFDYAYAPNGIDLTSVSTGGQTLFSASYDANHNITSLTDASGATTGFTYNSRGQVTSTTNPLGETTNYTYTGTGNLATIEAPLGKTTTFAYDSAERVSSVTDSEGYTAQVSYDSLDRPLSVIYPDGTTDTITYNRLDVVATKDRLNRTTQMSHDNLGRVTSILDANGGTTSLGYGLVNAPTSLTDPNGNTTTFQFDLQQRLATKQYADGASQSVTYESCCGRTHSVTDALGNTKTYSYFLDNQLKSIDYSGTTPDVFFTNDTFLPRPTSMSDGQGITTLTYVPVGSPGANQIASISGPFGDTATFNYDVAGRPAGSIINGSNSSVSYDALWRPTSVTNELDTFNMTYLGTTGQVTGVTSALGPAMEYTYSDNVGDRRLLQVKNLTNAGGALSQFDYSYDAVGQITQLVSTYGTATGGAGGGSTGGGGTGGGTGGDDDGCDDDHDGHGHGHGKKHGHKKGRRYGHKLGHKEKGNRFGKDHGHGVPEEVERRRKELLCQINEVLKNVWGFGHNPNFDPDHCDDDDDGGNGGGNGGGGGTGTGTTETWDFTYDNLSQLVGVNLNQTAYASYQIDPAGNLTSVTVDGITTNFTHNNLNQSTDSGAIVYDAKGQTGTDSEGRTFEWDEQGRVTAIVQGTLRSEFEYDGMSRRTIITELDNGTVLSQKLYWWLGGAIVNERDGLQTGFPITKRYFGQGVIDNGTKLFYTTDHLGSVRELLDETGTIVAEYRYSIYGERTKVSGAGDSDFGFAGLFHHEPSGLDLATYRLYDSAQRRFISRDPLGEGVDYNLYRYCGNDPVNCLDPSGLLPGDHKSHGDVFSGKPYVEQLPSKDIILGIFLEAYGKFGVEGKCTVKVTGTRGRHTWRLNIYNASGIPAREETFFYAHPGSENYVGFILPHGELYPPDSGNSTAPEFPLPLFSQITVYIKCQGIFPPTKPCPGSEFNYQIYKVNAAGEISGPTYSYPYNN